MTSERIESKRQSVKAWRTVVNNVWCRSKRWEISNSLNMIQTLMNLQPVSPRSAKAGNAITVSFNRCRRLISFRRNVTPLLHKIVHQKVKTKESKLDQIIFFLEPIMGKDSKESLSSRIEHTMTVGKDSIHAAKFGYKMSFAILTEEVIEKFKNQPANPKVVQKPLLPALMARHVVDTDDIKEIAHRVYIESGLLIADKDRLIDELQLKNDHLELLVKELAKTARTINDKKRLCLARLASTWAHCDQLSKDVDAIENILLTDFNGDA